VICLGIWAGVVGPDSCTLWPQPHTHTHTHRESGDGRVRGVRGWPPSAPSLPMPPSCKSLMHSPRARPAPFSHFTPFFKVKSNVFGTLNDNYIYISCNTCMHSSHLVVNPCLCDTHSKARCASDSLASSTLHSSLLRLGHDL
jgi:hypothetical protein